MRAVRNRADARWAPSRFNFAIFRLGVLIIGSRVPVEDRADDVLVIDRNQNSVESYAVSFWLVASLSAYTQSLMVRPVGWIAATLLSVPIVLASLQIIVVAGGFVVLPAPGSDHTPFNGALLMTVFAALSAWIASTSLWSRHIGMLFLIIVAINATAAVVIRLLGKQVAAADRARGVPD